MASARPATPLRPRRGRAAVAVGPRGDARPILAFEPNATLVAPGHPAPRHQLLPTRPESILVDSAAFEERVAAAMLPGDCLPHPPVRSGVSSTPRPARAWPR